MAKSNRISADLGPLYPRLKAYHPYWGEISAVLKRLVSNYLDKRDKEEKNGEPKRPSPKASSRDA